MITQTRGSPQIGGGHARAWNCHCLLYVDEAFRGWEVNSVWDDMHFAFKHRNEIERIAVVGGHRSAEWATKFAGLSLEGAVSKFLPDVLTIFGPGPNPDG